MVRSWNCLCKNRILNKVRKQNTQLILRQAKLVDHFYLKAAFNGLNQNRKQCKYEKANQELVRNVMSRIDFLKLNIETNS